MTEQEFIDRIKFSRFPDPRGLVLTATFSIEESAVIGQYAKDERVVMAAKGNLKELLLRKVYEDRSKELYESIMDLEAGYQMPGFNLHSAIARVMAAAKRQSYELSRD